MIAPQFNWLGKSDVIMHIKSASGGIINIKAIDFLTDHRYISKLNFLYATCKSSFLISSSVVVAAILIACIIFWVKGIKVIKDEEVRGGKIINSKLLRALINKDNKKSKYLSYTLGDIPYPAHSENTHTLIAGSTGSGKTILISELINQIRQRGDRAILYDKMGVYTERFYDKRKDILLNPFDKRSHTWNIFKEVKQEANFDTIAASLMPLEKGNYDPFWIKAARTIFAEVCSSLHRKGGVSNKELVNTLLKKDLTQAARLVKGTAAQAIIDPQSPKTALSVMSILSTYLKCMKFLRDDGENFSIKDWVMDDNREGYIFIPSNGDLHASLTPLISCWIEIAINNILSLSRSRQRKIWIILDELPSLHNLPSLEQGLSETRQYGGCFVLSLQAISQLRDRYGFNGAQTISSLCNNKVFLRAGDHDSAKWYADNIGSIEIEEFREGLSYGAHEVRDGVSINKQKVTRQLVMPSELLKLASKEGYFCMAGGYPVSKVNFEYRDWPILNKKIDEAPIDFLSHDEESEETADSDKNKKRKKKLRVLSKVGKVTETGFFDKLFET